MICTTRLLTVALLALCPRLSHARSPLPAPYLSFWAGDADTLDGDVLAVMDVRPGSPTYAQVHSTLPVGAQATRPHHTEHQLEPDRLLFANGFAAGRTFRFDLARPDRPRLLGSFTEVGGFGFPHSFTPHWMALDAGGSRLVVNDARARLVLVTPDQATGALAIDSPFRDPAATAPGVRFSRTAWPHGNMGAATSHGSVFARP